MVKDPPAMWETWVQFLGWKDPLEKGMATHSRILPWGIKKMRLEQFLTAYTKINSKWVRYLNVRPETIKLLEENIATMLDGKSKQDPLYPPPRVTEIKTKVNKWDLIKLKSF